MSDGGANLNGGGGMSAMDMQNIAEQADGFAIENIGNSIAATVESIGNLAARISDIVAQLQALEPPKVPGEDASEEEQQAYEAALSKFMADVDRLNGQLQSLQKDMAQLELKLKMLEGKMDQAKADQANKQMDAARQQLQDAMSKVGDLGGEVDSAEGENWQVRVETKKQEVVAQVEDMTLREFFDFYSITPALVAPFQDTAGALNGPTGGGQPEIPTNPEI